MAKTNFKSFLGVFNFSSEKAVKCLNADFWSTDYRNAGSHICEFGLSVAISF